MNMPKKKTIRVSCYGVVNMDSPWEDVWISFKKKRKKVYYAPTIIGRNDLEFCLKFEKELLSENPIFEKSTLNEYEGILSEFEKGVRFSATKIDTPFPDIYINKDMINKEYIEKAISWFLIKTGELKSEPRFRWNKNKDLVIIPY